MERFRDIIEALIGVEWLTRNLEHGARDLVAKTPFFPEQPLIRA